MFLGPPTRPLEPLLNQNEIEGGLIQMPFLQINSGNLVVFTQAAKLGYVLDW